MATVAVLWLMAWFLVPPLVKAQIETRGSELLGRELRLGAVELMPSKLALTLSDLSIAGAPGTNGAPPQLQVDRLYLDLDLRSVLRLAPVIEALEIDAPKVRLTRLGEGRYDIDDLIQRFSKPPTSPKSDEPARFALFNVQLRNGEFNFDDQPMGRVHKVSALTLNLPFLSNLPDHVQVNVEPRLAFVIDGSAFDISGQSKPFADGRASQFNLNFDKFKLQPLWAYMPRQLPVRAEGGVLAADLALRFEQHTEGPAQVAVTGRMALAGLALRDATEAPLLEWRQLALKLAEVRPLEQQVALESLQLDGLRLHVQRDAAGGLNLQRLASPAAPAGGASAPASAATASTAPSASPSASAAGADPGSTQGTKPALRFVLKHLELNDARVEFVDAAVAPPLHAALDAVSVTLDGLRWPFEADATLKLQARVQVADADAGQVQAQGTLSDRQAKLTLALQGLQVAAAQPYLRAFLKPRASASVDADVLLDWATGSEPRLAVAMAKLRVADFDLRDSTAPALGSAGAGKGAKPAASTKASVPSSLARAALLEVSDLRADLLKKQVSVGSLLVQRPFVELARDAQGRFNASGWLADTSAQPPTQPPHAKTADAPGWRAELRDFKLEAGELRFSDAALGPAPIEVDKLRLLAQRMAWPLTSGAAALNTEVSARMRKGGLASAAGRSAADAKASAAVGSLDWRGRVGLSPLAAKGTLRVERFPVHVFEPYFGAALPVLLKSAEAGFSGTVDMRQAGPSWIGALRGDALLADVRVNARGVAQAAPGTPKAADASDLLSWNALALSALSVELRAQGKPRIEIGELRLSDYFARLEISEQGRLNLQNIADPQAADDSTKPPPSAAAVAAVAPNTPASAADIGFGSRLRNMPIELVLGSAQLNNGQVDFSDQFVRPNYRAQLSDLNGRIGRFDSTAIEPATLQFTGRVAGTGLLDIGGTVNPTSNPPALDIAAKATDIELPGLTTYAAKYAGYPIERGKLSVDVGYKIDSQGKLEARNQIIVNQLTFGPKSDSPDATKLPVRLAVALLQDSNGVIDINLPLTGSINDPQFSLGGLIWKVIVNLFTKVLTAPFSVFAGGADNKDLSSVAFQPGTAVLAEGEQATIDKVAKALSDRPALNLTVAGQASAQAEGPAMQRAALEQRVLDEQRRERARGSLGSSAAADAPLPPLSPEQRTQIVKVLYSQTDLPDKPRNAVGLVQDLPLTDMEARLAAAVPVGDATARALAVQRARTVREAFITKGLGSERLFLAAPDAKPATADNAPERPQALLTVAPR